jgi:hypothetical protein
MTKKRSSCFSSAPAESSVGHSFHLRYDVVVAFGYLHDVTGLKTDIDPRIRLRGANNIGITIP